MEVKDGVFLGLIKSEAAVGCNSRVHAVKWWKQQERLSLSVTAPQHGLECSDPSRRPPLEMGIKWFHGKDPSSPPLLRHTHTQMPSL